MKVAIVAVMVVLAMGTAFVGGLLVASKMMANGQEPPVQKAAASAAKAPVGKKDEAAKAKGSGKESSVVEGLDIVAKKGTKEPTTDELIALIDYSVVEAREVGKMLFRKKVAENMKDAEKQFESESDKAREKERLAGAIQRWLERSKNL